MYWFGGVSWGFCMSSLFISIYAQAAHSIPDPKALVSFRAVFPGECLLFHQWYPVGSLQGNDVCLWVPLCAKWLTRTLKLASNLWLIPLHSLYQLIPSGQQRVQEKVFAWWLCSPSSFLVCPFRAEIQNCTGRCLCSCRDLQLLPDVSFPPRGSSGGDICGFSEELLAGPDTQQTAWIEA